MKRIYKMSLPVCLLILGNVGCSLLTESPQIVGVKPTITSIDTRGVNLDFAVDVDNPWQVALGTPQFRYGIEVEDNTLFESIEAVQVALPAGQVSTATLPVQIKYADLFKSVRSVIGEREVDYTLRGDFLVSALGQNLELPLSYEGSVPILQMLKFTFEDVDFSGLSLNGAEVKADFGVSNPNGFAVGADQLGYKLRIGDVEVADLRASTLGELAADAKGALTLTGGITAKRALTQLLAGKSLGKTHLTTTGRITTPYGAVQVDK